MKNKLLLLLAAPLLAGCFATSADLREIAYRVDEYNAGAITEEELSEALNKKADEIEARAEDLANSLPTTPAGWFALLLKLGSTAAAGAAAGGVGVNHYRNAARMKRGEPVGRPLVDIHK